MSLFTAEKPKKMSKFNQHDRPGNQQVGYRKDKQKEESRPPADIRDRNPVTTLQPKAEEIDVMDDTMLGSTANGSPLAVHQGHCEKKKRCCHVSSPFTYHP